MPISGRNYPNFNPRPLEGVGIPGQYQCEFSSLQWWGRLFRQCLPEHLPAPDHYGGCEVQLKSFIFNVICFCWSYSYINHRRTHFKIFLSLPSGVISFKSATKQVHAFSESMGAIWETSLLKTTQPVQRHPQHTPVPHGLLDLTPSTYIHTSEMTVGPKQTPESNHDHSLLIVIYWEAK